ARPVDADWGTTSVPAASPFGASGRAESNCNACRFGDLGWRTDGSVVSADVEGACSPARDGGYPFAHTMAQCHSWSGLICMLSGARKTPLEEGAAAARIR